MKINPIANPNILSSYLTAKPAEEKARVANKRDEVTFSEEALSFSKTLAEARESIEIRTPEERAHIAAITDAVRQGDYKIDSFKIADKILESVYRR